MGERAGLSVVTWNAQGSQGLDVEVAAAALGAFDPDLVLLQEVQRRHVSALRRALGAEDSRWRFKHWPVTLPAEGLGVVSKLTLHDIHVQVLAHRWQGWNWRRRIALHFAVEVGDRLHRCVDVHLGAGVPSAERIRQAQRLCDMASGADLIAGDLNAEPETHELDVFAKLGWRDAERRRHRDVVRPSTNWQHGARIAPATQRLDYVLVRDEVDVIEAFVPDDWARWAALSDHLPVVTRLRF